MAKRRKGLALFVVGTALPVAARVDNVRIPVAKSDRVAKLLGTHERSTQTRDNALDKTNSTMLESARYIVKHGYCKGIDCSNCYFHRESGNDCQELGGSEAAAKMYIDSQKEPSDIFAVSEQIEPLKSALEAPEPKYDGPIDLSNPKSVPVGTKVRIINAEYGRHKLHQICVIIEVDTDYLDDPSTMSYLVGTVGDEDCGIWYRNTSIELATKLSAKELIAQGIARTNLCSGVSCDECPLFSGAFDCDEFDTRKEAAEAYLARDK